MMMIIVVIITDISGINLKVETDWNPQPKPPRLEFQMKHIIGGLDWMIDVVQMHCNQKTPLLVFGESLKYFLCLISLS